MRKLRRFFRRLFRLRRWRRHAHRRDKKNLFLRTRLYLRWGMRVFIFLLALDGFYLAHIWPDWQAFANGPVAKSSFIKTYAHKRKKTARQPPLRWQPVRLSQIPRHMRRAVIVAEDARFYAHHGLDLIALKDAVDYNLEHLQLKYGASTISQQTIKNMFFTPARTPLRKWHELIFTLTMEMKIKKNRILETYLNIAEFGQGVYGVEAAAQVYWGLSASELSLQQSAELAASLPSPKKHNPKTRTQRFKKRAEKIYRYLQEWKQGTK